MQQSCPCPDRHNPKLECGYPMPCPHHTPECARKIRVLVVFDERKKRKTRTAKRPRGRRRR